MVELAPAAVGGTDVGRPALGRGRELTNANYDAKLLAKYVSPCRIRLLRGRFMVRGKSVFWTGPFKSNRCKIMDMYAAALFLYLSYLQGYCHCSGIRENESLV